MSKSIKSQPYLEDIRYGIFFNKPLDRLDKLITLITEKYSTIFDTQPTIFPFIPGYDDAITAQVGSENTQWQLNISRKRADIIYTPSKDKQYTYDDLTMQNNQIQEMILDMADIVRKDFESDKNNKIEVSRITNISRFIFECENPEEMLKNLFFNEREKGQRHKELSIRSNSPIEEIGLVFNNLTTYEVRLYPDILKIQKDFNTDISKSTFNNEDIKQFWNITKKYSHTISELDV